MRTAASSFPHDRPRRLPPPHRLHGRARAHARDAPRAALASSARDSVRDARSVARAWCALGTRRARAQAGGGAARRLLLRAKPAVRARAPLAGIRSVLSLGTRYLASGRPRAARAHAHVAVRAARRG